ncbi:MAG: helix-turn-helix domain-containing protein [Clostridia bacterium]|nr:helix-turn-helix domain-containing protein [Clostridia bacterium]
MELSEKIVKLRKENDLTQEQLAQKLFVSRTAVSKWETGRGTPGVDSLKAIAKLFGVTLDELLSTQEAVNIAEEEKRQSARRAAAVACGAIDVTALLAQLLPLYKAEENGFFYSTPLYKLGGWQGAVFWIAPALMAVCGILQLILAGKGKEKALSAAGMAGMALHIPAILLPIVCGHPYAAALSFFLFALKCLLLLKKRQ